LTRLGYWHPPLAGITPDGQASKVEQEIQHAGSLCEALHGKASTHGSGASRIVKDLVMSFSLDTPSIQTLKSEAKALREARAKTAPLSHGAALEAIAKSHGFRDWNTARAMLPERVATPFLVGGRVKGTYLGHNIRGLVVAVQLMADMQHYKVSVKLDEPVDVVTSKLFSAFRKRITSTLDIYGVSPARTGNGQPQMRLTRE
jgi:hypothetical protein